MTTMVSARSDLSGVNTESETLARRALDGGLRSDRAVHDPLLHGHRRHPARGHARPASLVGEPVGAADELRTRVTGRIAIEADAVDGEQRDVVGEVTIDVDEHGVEHAGGRGT